MCPRNQSGGADNPLLIGAELTLDAIRTLLPKNLLQGVHEVLACGNYGDPIVCRDLLPIVVYLREFGCRLSMNTNGSLRDPMWWSQLGSLLNRPGDRIKFGIDGLADTNATYRRYTSFDKIIANAQSFIAAGGVAEWEFIVFRHNEHQIEEAREMAAHLGFSVFRLKRTGRFYDPKLRRVREQHPVLNRDGSLAYVIEPPIDPQYRNDATMRQRDLIEKYGSFAAYLDTTEITCKVVEQGSVYISARGLVFPCCWTAQIYDDMPDVLRLLETCDSINGLLVPITEIVRGEFFQRIAQGWGTTCAGGRLGICARICGSEFDQFRATPMASPSGS